MMVARHISNEPYIDEVLRSAGCLGDLHLIGCTYMSSAYTIRLSHSHPKASLTSLLIFLHFTTKPPQSPAMALTAAQATDIVNIQQVLSLFAIAVDQHRYDLLSKIFTSDATINFNTPDRAIVTGVEALTDRLTTRLQNINSTHNQTTNYVNFSSATNAYSTTYVVVTFFGGGNFQGQVYTSYNRYVKENIRISAKQHIIIGEISLDMRMIW